MCKHPYRKTYFNIKKWHIRVDFLEFCFLIPKILHGKMLTFSHQKPINLQKMQPQKAFQIAAFSFLSLFSQFSFAT